MKTTHAIVALAALAITPVIVSSAESSVSIAPSSERKVYKVRPGDRVSVVVFGHERLGVKEAEVDAKGELRIAGVADPLPAAGLSVADLQAIAESRYKKNGIENPRVSILILKYAPR
jgi:protein involved in polysaccharide export with SLBB domain